MYINHLSTLCLLLCPLSLGSSSNEVSIDNTPSSITCTDPDECNISCDESNTCYDGKIFSQSRDTTINCQSHGSCSHSHIFCGNMSLHESHDTIPGSVRLNDCTVTLSSNTMHSNLTFDCRDMDDCTITNTKSSSLVHSTINCVHVQQCTLFCPTDISCLGSTIKCDDTSTCLCLGDGCNKVSHSGGSMYESPVATKLVMVSEEVDTWYNIPISDLIFVNVLCFIFCGCCCCGLIICGLIKLSMKSIEYHRTKVGDASQNGECNQSAKSPHSKASIGIIKSPTVTGSWLKTPTMDHVASHSGDVDVVEPIEDITTSTSLGTPSTLNTSLKTSSSLKPRRQFGFRSFSKNSSKTPCPMQSIDLDAGSTASIIYLGAADHDDSGSGQGAEVVYEEVVYDQVDKSDGDDTGSESTDNSGSHSSRSHSSQSTNSYEHGDRGDFAYAGGDQTPIKFKNSLSARDPTTSALETVTTTPTYVSALALHNKISNIADIPEASAVSENTYTMVFGDGTPRNLMTGSPYQSGKSRNGQKPNRQTASGSSGNNENHGRVRSEGAESVDELQDLSIKVNVSSNLMTRNNGSETLLK